MSLKELKSNQELYLQNGLDYAEKEQAMGVTLLAMSITGLIGSILLSEELEPIANKLGQIGNAALFVTTGMMIVFGVKYIENGAWRASVWSQKIKDYGATISGGFLKRKVNL